MINFEIKPRQSGKTFELINLYKENPGLYIVPNRTLEKYMIAAYGSNTFTNKNILNICTTFEYINKIYDGYEYFYFDELNLLDGEIKLKTYKKIIKLDNSEKNIFIRMSNNESLPKFFMNYLKDKYPESLI